MTFIEIENALIEGRADELHVNVLHNTAVRYEQLVRWGGVYAPRYAKLAKIARDAEIRRYN